MNLVNRKSPDEKTEHKPARLSRRKLHSENAFLFLLVVGAIFLHTVVTQRPARSQEAAPTPLPAAQSGAETPGQAPVKVNGRTLLTLTDINDAQALLRADRVHLRLERLIARDQPVAAVRPQDIVDNQGQPLITLGGEPVLTVTLADAENNLMSPQQLALIWSGKLSVAVAEARAARANPLQGIGYLIRYSFRDLIQSIARWLPRLAGAVLVWMAFWVLARSSRWLVKLLTQRIPLDPNIRQLIRAVTFYGVWAAGLMAILSTLGIDSTSIATAVGISGFVLGFAFKDILSHFFAGLMLLMGRQLHIGGQVTVGEFEGTVERIELRALHLRTSDNRLVTIPNGDVFTSAVTSSTAYSNRRREFKVAIGYEHNIRQAQALALKTLRAIPGVLDSPPPQVLVHELAGASVNLRVLFHTAATAPNFLEIGSECIRQVKEAFEREGFSVPAPLHNIDIRNIDELSRIVGKPITPANRSSELHNGNSRN